MRVWMHGSGASRSPWGTARRWRFATSRLPAFDRSFVRRLVETHLTAAWQDDRRLDSELGVRDFGVAKPLGLQLFDSCIEVRTVSHAPRNPGANTAIYGDTPMHIVVAGSRCSEVGGTFARGGSSTPCGNLQEDTMSDQTDLIRGTLDLLTMRTIGLEPRLSAGVELVLERT